MGRLDSAMRRFMAETLAGFLARDYLRVAQVHFDYGFVPKHHHVETFAQALRAVGEPIFGLNALQVSMGRLLEQLFETTRRFDMQLQPQLVLLQKTMVVVEGVARSLDPKLDMWTTADPVVREWIARNLGPVGRLEDAVEGAGQIGRFFGQVPGLLMRAGTLLDQFDDITRDGLVLSPETVAAIGAAEARRNRWTASALWVIAALLLWIAWMLV
jgi:ubiquinone biosynthesis protein